MTVHLTVLQSYNSLGKHGLQLYLIMCLQFGFMSTSSYLQPIAMSHGHMTAIGGHFCSFLKPLADIIYQTYA